MGLWILWNWKFLIIMFFELGKLVEVMEFYCTSLPILSVEEGAILNENEITVCKVSISGTKYFIVCLYRPPDS